MSRWTVLRLGGGVLSVLLLGCTNPPNPDPRLTVRVEDATSSRICIRPIDPARERFTGCYALDTDERRLRPGMCARVLLPARYGIEGPVNEPIREVTLLGDEVCLPAPLTPS